MFEMEVRKVFFILVFFILSNLFFETTVAQLVEPSSGISLRLPKSLSPIHYTVKLRPFLQDNFTIDGSLELQFKAIHDTDIIVLHMSDIETHNETAKVTSDDEASLIPILSQSYDPIRQFYILNLGKESLKEGKRYTLYVEFIGVLSTDLEGFYRTSYIDSKKEKRWVAATQFQATNARRAFPCFDEPQLKATFDVYLGRKEYMTALSNMPLEKTEKIKGEIDWVYDKFQTSVPMSTYLLAFVVCDFGSVTATNNLLKTDLKLWSRNDTLATTEFGLDVSAKGLLHLEEFFNLSFPLPKLDIVAVPEMSPNAMENWGLIITRESGLLHVVEKGSVAHRQWVAYLICHELAHQWFGNIVTMKWWDDLWLNEGLATFIGYSVADYIFPSWKIFDQFVVKSLHKILQLDALSTAPPVSVPVEDPQQIREVFGDIAYKKGASVVRMMKYFLGERTFRIGLSRYLEEMKYKSATQDDLWFCLTQVALEEKSLPRDFTIKDIMDTWTTQTGFPIVSVKKRTEHSITLTQKVFKLSTAINRTDTKWFIPITWSSQENPSKVSATLWIKKDEPVKTFGQQDVPPVDDWILINPNQTAYYRVNYDPKTWKQLIGQLLKDHSAIPVISRAQLIDDALNLAKIGILDYKTAMNVMAYLDKETEYVPWSAALENMFYLDTMLRVTSLYGALKDYLLLVISPMYEKLGIYDAETDDDPKRFLRKEVVTWACYLGHADCLSAALNFTASWILNPDGPSPAPGNLADTLYCAAVRESDENIWNFFWDRYQETTNADLRKSLSTGLGCSRQPWVLQRYLDSAFNPELGIKRQDASAVYRIVSSNVVGSFLTWNHMKQNWIKVKDYIGTSMFALPALVKSATSGFNTAQYRDEMMWFTSKYEGNFGPAKWAMKQGLETTEANIDWMATNFKSIETWLKDKGFSSKLQSL